MENIKEEWRPVKGFEGYYEVSNLGRVRSLDRVDSVGRVRIGKILKQSAKNNGYMHLVLSANGIKKNAHAHRLVAQAFIPNPLNKMDVNHIDGDKTNNKVDNLEWATRSENQKHAYDIGLQPKDDSRFAGFESHNKEIRVPVIVDGDKYFKSQKAAAQYIGVTLSGVQTALKRDGKCNGHVLQYARSDIDGVSTNEQRLRSN